MMDQMVSTLLVSHYFGFCHNDGTVEEYIKFSVIPDINSVKCSAAQRSFLCVCLPLVR